MNKNSAWSTRGGKRGREDRRKTAPPSPLSICERRRSSVRHGTESARYRAHSISECDVSSRLRHHYVTWRWFHQGLTIPECNRYLNANLRTPGPHSAPPGTYKKVKNGRSAPNSTRKVRQNDVTG